MKRRFRLPASRFAVRVASFALVTVVAARLVAAGADTAPAPRAGSCSEACDRKAAECLEECDGRFKEDKPRVECKMQCATDRQKCDAACPSP